MSTIKENKPKKLKRYPSYKKNKYKTGEDIEMLNEHKYEPQSSDKYGSYKYRDDIDSV